MSETVNFQRVLDSILTQEERELLRETDTNEGQKHLKTYDLRVWEERKRQDEFRAVLCKLVALKGEGIETITDLRDEVCYAQMDQGYVVDEIINHVRSRSTSRVNGSECTNWTLVLLTQQNDKFV